MPLHNVLSQTVICFSDFNTLSKIEYFNEKLLLQAQSYILPLLCIVDMTELCSCIFDKYLDKR
jgi:hypothetical protein